MSFILLDQLTGPLADIVANFKGLFRHVKYGIKADVGIGLTAEFTHLYERRGAMFTNMLSPFGFLNASITEDSVNNSGVNVQFLNDNGQVDEMCIQENLKLSGHYRQNVITAIAPMLATLSGENHVSVLINMLRVYQILLSQPSDFEVKPDDLFYDDGHINISYRNYLKKDFGNWKGLEFDGFSIEVQRFSETDRLTNRMYCPNVENMNSREFNIFCTLLCSIECDYPLRIAFSSPALVETVHLPLDSKHGNSFDVVNDMTAKEVMNVLRKYVFANRVANDFDLAYLTVVNAMYAPLPRCAEAHGWLSPIGNINLPKVSSIRGFMRLMTQGSPYEPQPDKLLTWANFLKEPERIHIHAFAATEAFYTGLFEILTANKHGIEDSLMTLGINSVANCTPYRMFCEATSYRFGKSFDINWDTNCGVDCYSHLLATTPIQHEILATVTDNMADGYEVYQVKHKDTKLVSVVSKDVKPALFPVLSMGINDDRYFINKKEYEVTLYHDPINETLSTVSSDDANKAMSIFRIGGYNATLIDRLTNKAMRNWASNSNGQVIPVLPPGLVGVSTYQFPTKYLNQRKNHWMTLPNIVEKLTMNVKIEVKGYVIMLNGKIVSGFMPPYKPIKVYPKAMTASNMTVIPLKTDPSLLKYRYQGFRLAASQVEAPVVHLHSLSMDTTDLQSSDPLLGTDGAPEDL
uniref:Capsid protein n=1 Tax=Dali Totiv tick virus 1 TaxID=2972361 RepID=A0A9E7V2G1_9VIRU|nr:MAG: capsid protein [Dali Totiv tick virus 1]